MNIAWSLRMAPRNSCAMAKLKRELIAHGITQAVVARRAGVCTDMVVKVCKAYADRGGDVQATISRKKRATPPVAPTVTGEVEARLVALACSAPPPGYDRWSLRLLEKHVVLVDDLPDLDHSTIGRVLKKTNFALI